MYQKLKSWSKHNNRELLHLGTAAMEAFLTQVRVENDEPENIKIFLNCNFDFLPIVIIFMLIVIKFSDIRSAGYKSKKREEGSSHVQSLCVSSFSKLLF